MNSPLSNLLEYLTDQIVANKIEVDEAREIVLRRQHYRNQDSHTVPHSVEQLKRLEVRMLFQAMRLHDGSVSRASSALGMPRKTLYLKLKKLGFVFGGESGNSSN